MWFFVGVGYMILGVAFCVLGSIRLLGGRVLRARHAQLCGVILLCYFPLIFLLQPFKDEWDPLVPGIVNGCLAFLCLLAVLLVILRTTRPPRPVRPHAQAMTTEKALLADEPLAGTPVAGNKPAALPGQRDGNPFDFS